MGPQRRPPHLHISPRRSSCARTVPGSPRPPTCTFRVSGPLAFWSPPSYPLPEYERAARQDFPRPTTEKAAAERIPEIPLLSSTRDTYTSTDRSLCRCHLRYCRCTPAYYYADIIRCCTT